MSTNPRIPLETSGKKVLLGMAVLAILMFFSLIFGKRFMETNAPVAMDWSQRGLSYGDGRSEAQCMHEASRNYQDCHDKNCRAQWGIFFARCIERAHALEARCIGAPDLKDKQETLLWRDQYCQRLDDSRPACLELAQWAHKFCLQ